MLCSSKTYVMQTVCTKRHSGSQTSTMSAIEFADWYCTFRTRPKFSSLKTTWSTVSRWKEYQTTNLWNQVTFTDFPKHYKIVEQVQLSIKCNGNLRHPKESSALLFPSIRNNRLDGFNLTCALTVILRITEWVSVLKFKKKKEEEGKKDLLLILVFSMYM